jgi:hypothetical protein
MIESLQKFPTGMLKTENVKSEEDQEYDDEDSLRRFMVKSKLPKVDSDYQLVYHHASSSSLNTSKKAKMSPRDSSGSNLRINDSKFF